MLNRDKILKLLKKTLKQDRLLHCLRVEKAALALADHFHLDKEKASIAALLHDLAKEHSGKKLLKLAKQNKLKIDPIEEFQPKLLHGPVSAIIAKKKLKIKDKNILSAISYHTTGAKKMGQLAKVVYLADHIESCRRYKGAKEVRALSRKDMDKAIVKCASSMIECLKGKKLPVCKKTIAARDYYLNHA